MIANIFLDFFNRDSREIYGLFANTTREMHVRFLTEATNLAAFLCPEYCILPPGFLAECGIAREAILRRSAYVTERLIRLPLRENTFDEFWEKKRREYSPFRDKYAGLFDLRNETMLRRFSAAIVSRHAKIADEILRSWEEGPDANNIWRGAIDSFTGKEIELIRAVPRQIRAEGAAVTWPAISERVTSLGNTSSPALRHILQNHYFEVYIREYGLTVITRLPFARVDFVLGAPDLSNDYEALKIALAALDLWYVVPNLSSESLIVLRSKAGYYKFRRAFETVARAVSTVSLVGECFARVASAYPASRSFKRLTSTHSGLIVPDRGYELSNKEIDAIADRLAIAESAEEELTSIMERESQTVRSIQSTGNKILAIYVALEMERRILVDRWKLTGAYPNQVWRGKLEKTNILLFGPNEMGRVSAAISTMQFLKEHGVPDMLLVMGIAGGFKREKVDRGHILIAKSIADLATRKILPTKDFIPEFRPKEFSTDSRLANYLQSGSFDRTKWEQAAIQHAEWPDGLRPKIHYGPLASLDEVVSDENWIETLCKVWPKLLGVEMESGGVCAAAAAFKLEVAVLRGVSDLADPAKSDDEWRRRAMKTAAHLLENIDLTQLLGDHATG